MPNNIEDIFVDFEYEAATPSEKKFYSWHKPRKQFVRKGQWVKQLQDMLKSDFDDISEISYLGLPGHDLLDLRCIYNDVCRDGEFDLRFLGFNNVAGTNSQEATDLNVSLDEMLKRKFVSSRSEIIGDNFKDIGEARSVAYQKIKNHGPFDIVNLDLCDGFANGEPGSMSSSHYNAMINILTLQSKRTKPWLLFLTTKVSSNDVHKDVIAKFNEVYMSNLRDCDPFLASSSERFGISNSNDVLKGDHCEITLLRVFLVGLCKWFATYNLNFRPQIVSEVKSAIGYKVYEDSPTQDLISLAIKFEPRYSPNSDSFGLGGLVASNVDECSLAPKILNRIDALKDADEVLNAAQEIKQQMIDETVQLLQSARYDPKAVHEWILNGCN